MEGDNRHIPGFEDFARYQNGEMSFGEQHIFEKRMLEDPVLAEAFEGFQLLNPSTEHREELRAELTNLLKNRLSPKRKNVLPLWYYSAAALLIIGIGISWLLISRNNITKPATTGEVSLATKQPVISPKTNTIPAPAEPAFSAPPGQEEAEPRIASAPNAAGKPRQSADESFQAAAKLDVAEERIAAAEGVQEQVTLIAPASAPAGILQDEPDSLASQKMAESARVARASKMVRVQGISQSMRKDSISPTPGIGWQAYQQYLEKQTANSSRSEVVTLRFVVNSDGTLQNFVTTAEDSLGQRSIKLILDGPAWKPALRQNAPISAPIQLQLHFRK